MTVVVNPALLHALWALLAFVFRRSGTVQVGMGVGVGTAVGEGVGVGAGVSVGEGAGVGVGTGPVCTGMPAIAPDRMGKAAVPETGMELPRTAEMMGVMRWNWHEIVTWAGAPIVFPPGKLGSG